MWETGASRHLVCATIIRVGKFGQPPNRRGGWRIYNTKLLNSQTSQPVTSSRSVLTNTVPAPALVGIVTSSSSAKYAAYHFCPRLRCAFAERRGKAGFAGRMFWNRDRLSPERRGPRSLGAQHSASYLVALFPDVSDAGGHRERSAVQARNVDSAHHSESLSRARPGQGLNLKTPYGVVLTLFPSL